MVRYLIVLAFALVNVYSQDVKTQCAKILCGKKEEDVCASVTAKIPKEARNEVNLADVCDHTKQYCAITPSTDIFSSATTSTTFKCAAKTPAPETKDRFPGEECADDKDCFPTPGDEKTGKCVKETKKCFGYDAKAPCKFTTQCIVGNYCAIAKGQQDGVCTPQKKSGETCEVSEECTNAILCDKGTCNLKPYSLPDGADPNVVDRFAAYKCAFGQTQDGMCVSLRHVDKTDPTIDNLIKCELGDKCKYTLGKGQVEDTCQCGYNAEGQGYCPRAKNSSNF
jgi:hypothetical protein